MSGSHILDVASYYKGKKVLVTGGAGFIGSHICQALADYCQVVIIDNFVSGARGNVSNLNVEIVEGDIRNIDFQSVVGKVDVIFHLAANVSLDLSLVDPGFDADVNCLGLIRLLEYARNTGIKRIVYSSSSAVYHPLLEIAVESDTPSPSSPYGITKLTGEYYLKLYNQLYEMENICLRYFNVFGPRQNPDSAYSGVVAIFMDRILRHQPITFFGDGKQTRDFVYVEDVAKANLLAGLCSATQGSINIGTGRDTSLIELADAISPGYLQVKFGPERLGDARKSRAVIDNAKKVLGFNPGYSLIEGIQKYREWYVSNNSSREELRMQ